MVRGILAARRDAVPEALECADSPSPLLAAFSSPPGSMNKSGMQANDAEALHREAAEGTQNERHRGLAGRRIVGGLLITAQEPRGRWWYLWAGVCRSRVTQPEAYGVFGLPSCSRFARSFMSRFSSVSLRFGKRPLHWMMGGRRLPLDIAQTARNLSFYPPGKRASTRGFIPSMDRVTRLYRGKPLTVLRSRGGGVLPRGIAGGGTSPRTPGLWPTVPWRARP